jgi:hypothetical protein
MTSSRVTRSPVGDAQVRRRPRLGLAAHDFLPELEALARRQPRAVRTDRVFLVGVARPVDRPQQLAAKEDRAIARRPRNRNRQKAGRAIAKRFARRVDLGDFGARANSSWRRAIDEPDQFLHLVLGRSIARQREAVVRPHRNAVAGDHLAVLVHEVGDRAARVGVGCGDLDHPLLNPVRLRLVGDGGLSLAALEQPRKHVSEEFSRSPALKRDVPRAVVMAGEQSP